MKNHFEKSPIQKPFSLMRKLAISALLISYFGLVILWLNPAGPFSTIIMPYLTPVIHATGIGQSWSVFSPDVREAIYHETALISFQDGLLKLYEFPRMQKLGLLERFRREKYRKMFFDSMPWPDYKQFLPDFGKFIGEANDCAANPPVMVSLVHHSCRIPQPDPAHWVNRSDLPEHTFQAVYYVYPFQHYPLQQGITK